MNLYHFFYNENLIFLIEFNMLIKKILLWNIIHIKMNLLILKVKQLKHKFLNIEKTVLHLWWKKEKHKNLFNKTY